MPDVTSYCLHCGHPIVKARYRDLGGYEPDYDPADDPITWRHQNGYAACSRVQSFAHPTDEKVTT